MLQAHQSRRLQVVVTGDNHLAQRLSRLPPAKAAARRERLCRAFADVVTAAIEREADLFVQAGDLFDTPDPNNRDRAFIATQFQRLSAGGIAACAVSGNHDMPRQSTEQGGVAPLQIYADLDAVRYFGDTRVIRPFLLERRNLRLAVGGLSNDPGRPPGEDPLAGVKVSDPDGVMARADAGLLIIHAAIAGDSVMLSPDECAAQPESVAALARLGFQTVVTGHIHRYSVRRFDGVTAIVCGPSERMDFGDDPNSPGYAWIEIGPGGDVIAEHVRFQAQPRRTERILAETLWPLDASLDGAADRVIERLAPFADEDLILRVQIAGSVTREQYRALDLHRVQVWCNEHYFACEVSERDLRLRDDLAFADDFVYGERVDPRAALAAIVAAQMRDAREDVALWHDTAEDVLARFDRLRAGGDVD